MNGTTSATVSPAADVSQEQLSGVVHLGPVRAYATWNHTDAEYLVVRFDNSRLTPDQSLELRYIRSSSQPLEIKLPRDRTLKGVVIGFENDPQGITLHIVKAVRTRAR